MDSNRGASLEGWLTPGRGRASTKSLSLLRTAVRPRRPTQRAPFDCAPFFWTDQYDFTLAYVGHAERWDSIQLEGQLEGDKRDCTITYTLGGKRLAVASVYRDQDSLRAEVAWESVRV